MLNKLIVKFLLVGMLATAGLLAGCNQTIAPGARLVFIVDLTGSIDPAAQAEAFKTLREVIAPASGGFKHLKRGDGVTVIPIIAAALDTQGRVVRFELSRQREAYDEDLQRLAAEVGKQLDKLEQLASGQPQPQSDLLGALDLAGQECGANGERCIVTILSDLIQDDAQYDFKRDERLANEAAGKAFAASLAAPKQFAGAAVYLGLLRSSDLKKLGAARQTALRAFWTDYFQRGGALRVAFATDGSGRLPQFLKVAFAPTAQGGENDVAAGNASR